jgi:hypothetical protein
VVNELIVPDAPAGVRIETNDTVGEKIVTGPVAAVVVARGCFDGKIDVAQVEIGAYRRPNRGVSGVLPRIGAPSVIAEFAALRNGVKRP